MSDFEKNKIFAAILLAGITVWLSDFIANKFVHPYELEKDAVFVEGSPVAVASGPAKPELPDPILHLIATADVAKGEKLSKACAACHSFDNGGPNKVGPNLWDMVNNPKGRISGFAYSDALKEMGGAWSYENLNFFLWKPKKYMPGTKMNYIGLRKPQDRADMIAWMRTLSPSPSALPNEAEVAAEKAAFDPEPVVEDVAEAVSDTAADLVEATEDLVAEDVEAVPAIPLAE